MTFEAYAWIGMGEESRQEVKRPELVCSLPSVASIYLSEGRETGSSVFVLQTL